MPLYAALDRAHLRQCQLLILRSFTCMSKPLSYSTFCLQSGSADTGTQAMPGIPLHTSAGYLCRDSRKLAWRGYWRHSAVAEGESLVAVVIACKGRQAAWQGSSGARGGLRPHLPVSTSQASIQQLQLVSHIAIWHPPTIAACYNSQHRSAHAHTVHLSSDGELPATRVASERISCSASACLNYAR